MYNISRRNERLYHIYYGIKARCYNPNNPKYNIYGGRGIIMCDQWLNDYETFKEWSYSHGYKENSNLSIDRIDSNKNYCPENCQWITLSENSAKANRGLHKNKSKKGTMIAESPNGDIIIIENVCQFCRENNLPRSSVSHRLNGIVQNPYLNNWKIYRQEI